MKKNQDFSPKLFVVGRHNNLVSILIELLLKEEQSRFGVKSAGMDPVQDLHPGLKNFLREYETDDVDPGSLRSTPISVALDDHVKLVAYVSSSVRQDAPIVATTGETLTLETDDLRSRLADSEDPAEFERALEELREQVIPDLLEPLGLSE